MVYMDWGSGRPWPKALLLSGAVGVLLTVGSISRSGAALVGPQRAASIPTQIPGEYVAMEIKACGKVLEQITGRAPHLFRPPGGDYNQQVAQVASALGYTMVLWTNDPGDYAKPGSSLIKSRVLSKIHNGEV